MCFLSKNSISQLAPCETLQSTTDIIVNLTSTAMGSNATYQCRNGSSDVYTTQCTSDGVWEPNPNSTLDCTITGIMPHIASFLCFSFWHPTMGSVYSFYHFSRL